ncbi:MAG TPA: cytochrome P450 [Ktedonobacterales bacterium]|jgi:cytochrome P450
MQIAATKQAPGPREKRATTKAMERDPLRFLMEMTQAYGDVVRLPLTYGTTYLINHPDGVRQVLQEHAQHYGRDPHENAIFRRFVGESILTTEGAAWKRLRKLEQPAFHRRHLTSVGGQMVAAAQAELETWQEPAQHGKIIDLVPAMKALTLRVLGSTIFSLDLSDESRTIGLALQEMNAYALALFFHPFLPYLGPLSGHNRRGQAALRALDVVVHRLIRKRRETLRGQQNHPDDLLTFLLELREEDGQPAFTDAQIRNETLSLLIAGHDNATSLLCWTWYLLAQHPEAAEHIYREVDEVLQGRTPGLEDLDALPFSRMVLDEALRLYPPAWSFPRHVLAEDTIGGYTIPAGTTVLVCPYTTHRHPAFWDEPACFRPERFTAAAQAERPRFAYFPFGGGQHQCMGNIYALLEAHIIMVLLAQRCHLELAPDVVLRPEPLVTLRPRELPMRVRDRA